MEDPTSLGDGHELGQLPHVEQDVSQPDLTSESNYQNLAKRTFRHEHLDRALERPQLTGITLSSSKSRPFLINSTGIAFSGTVGMGIWTNTGELISISGSAGCVIAYTVSAFLVTAVMRSLAELVSVRPFAGALMDFPSTFVDPALGFAVGVTYWYVAPCVSSTFRWKGDSLMTVIVGLHSVLAWQL